MGKQIKDLIESVRIKDTWAIWHPEDKRTYKDSTNYSTEKLTKWYGTNSKEWLKLIKNKTNPSIMFIGEAPIKNTSGSNADLIGKTDLKIQCFHSNSSMDKLLKTLYEKNSFFQNASITDFFHSAYEYNGKTIKLDEIQRKFPKEWIKIKKKEGEHFIKNVKKGYGSKAILCFGDISFNNICNFFKIKKDIIRNIGNRVKYIEISYNEQKLRIFKIDHPSQRNGFRKELFKELPFIKNKLQKC